MAKPQGWGENDQPVASSGGYGANDVPVGESAPQMPKDAPPAEDKHSIGGFAGNVVTSGGKLLGDIGHAVMSPFKTAGNIADLGVGALQAGARKLGGNPNNLPPSKQEQMLSGAGQGLANRYGGLAKTGETLYHDPVGVASDVSAVTGAGEALTGSRLLGKASTVTNPLTLPLRGGGALLRKSAEFPFSLGTKLRPKDYEYGSNPSEVGLRRTSSFTPGGIETEARQQIGPLMQANERALSQSGQQGATISHAPYRQTIDDAIAARAQKNLPPDALSGVSHQLTDPVPGFRGQLFQPPAPMVPRVSPVLGPNGQKITTMVPGTPPPPQIAATQDPLTTHFMKQGMGERAHFDPYMAKNKQPAVSPSRDVYNQMNKDIEATTPGYAARNKDVQGLIGLRDRAHVSELGSGIGEDIFNRARARTGGLIPTIAAGEVGGPVAAGATLVGQALMSSPRTLIGAGRGMYGLGKRLPSADFLGKGGPLFRLKEGDQ